MRVGNINDALCQLIPDPIELFFPIPLQIFHWQIGGVTWQLDVFWNGALHIARRGSALSKA